MVTDNSAGGDNSPWYEDPVAGPEPPRRPWRWLAIGVAASVLLGLVWAGYRAFGPGQGGDGEVPTVVADKTPIRVRPADPKGLELAAKNETLVQGIGSKDESQGKKVERLLPAPEEPMAKPPPVAAPPQIAVTPPAAAAPPPPAPAAAAPQPKPTVPGASPPPTKPAPAAAAAPSTPAPAPGAVAAGRPLELPAPGAEAGAARAPAAGDGGGPFRLQLGAFRSNEAAEGAWTKIKGANADIFGKASATMNRIDLGPEKGIYFRIQAGSYRDREGAVAACETLRQRKVSCFIVRG